MSDEPVLSPPITVPGGADLQRPEAPRLEREVFDHREQRAAYGTDPQDGLPRPVAETTSDDTHVLPLAPDTFICMGDLSVFTLPNAPDVEFRPEEVTPDVQASRRLYFVPYALALERIGPERQNLIGFRPSDAARFPNALVPVHPKRQPCKHYVRQMTDFGTRAKGFVARYCTALRDESGEYQSLRDTGLYACELRDPPDAASVKLLDEFDARKITEGRERLQEQVAAPFDVDAALRIDPLPGQLIGHWMPRDAIPEQNQNLRPDSGLLLLEDGSALDIIRGKGWTVLGSDEVQQCAHSRHWPKLVDSDEYVFIAYESEARRIFRVTGVTPNYPRAEVTARFGEQAASRMTHQSTPLLTVVEEKQEQP